VTETVSLGRITQWLLGGVARLKGGARSPGADRGGAPGR
jgi:hypothetical protein